MNLYLSDEHILTIIKTSNLLNILCLNIKEWNKSWTVSFLRLLFCKWMEKFQKLKRIAIHKLNNKSFMFKREIS